MWDLWSWPQSCPWLTHSRLSSWILQEEALKELEKGLLRFVQNTWHLGGDRPGRAARGPDCFWGHARWPWQVIQSLELEEPQERGEAGSPRDPSSRFRLRPPDPVPEPPRTPAPGQLSPARAGVRLQPEARPEPKQARGQNPGVWQPEEPSSPLPVVAFLGRDTGSVPGLRICRPPCCWGSHSRAEAGGQVGLTCSLTGWPG